MPFRNVFKKCIVFPISCLLSVKGMLTWMLCCTARRTTTFFLVRPHPDARSYTAGKLTLHRTSSRPAPLCRSLRPMELCATPSGLDPQVQPRMVGLLDDLHPRAFRDVSFPPCLRSVLTSQTSQLPLFFKNFAYAFHRTRPPLLPRSPSRLRSGPKRQTSTPT